MVAASVSAARSEPVLVYVLLAAVSTTLRQQLLGSYRLILSGTAVRAYWPANVAIGNGDAVGNKL